MLYLYLWISEDRGKSWLSAPEDHFGVACWEHRCSHFHVQVTPVQPVPHTPALCPILTAFAAWNWGCFAEVVFVQMCGCERTGLVTDSAFCRHLGWGMCSLNIPREVMCLYMCVDLIDKIGILDVHFNKQIWELLDTFCFLAGYREAKRKGNLTNA